MVACRGKWPPVVPINRWLVLDPMKVELVPAGKGGDVVTLSVSEPLQQKVPLLSEINGNSSVGAVTLGTHYGNLNAGVVMLGSHYGNNDESFNTINESEGVVLVDQKRKKGWGMSRS